MIYIMLPAYNEEKNLVKIFKKIEKLVAVRKNIRVVLIDDFSSDNTKEIANKWREQNDFGIYDPPIFDSDLIELVRRY